MMSFAGEIEPAFPITEEKYQVPPKLFGVGYEIPDGKTIPDDDVLLDGNIEIDQLAVKLRGVKGDTLVFCVGSEL